ncbi:MAG: hypothetical protein WB782_07055 [Thermoplasmata archaeon]
MDNKESEIPSSETDWWTSDKARVFISCGQGSEKEREIASKTRIGLERNGFAVYVGVETHSSNGLNENIFRYLETSEYVVFIEFPKDRADFHESIFSHQELAIASYVKADLLPFLPEGGFVRKGVPARKVVTLPENPCVRGNQVLWPTTRIKGSEHR